MLWSKSRCRIGLRWIYTVSVFALFCPFLNVFSSPCTTICSFSSAFLYAHIRTNQTVTYWTKVFQKNNFVKGYSLILKYHFHCSSTTLLKKILSIDNSLLIADMDFKNADEKAHTFYGQAKTDKNGQKTDTV